MESNNLNLAKRIARQRLQSLYLSGLRVLPKATGTSEFEYLSEPAADISPGRRVIAASPDKPKSRGELAGSKPKSLAAPVADSPNEPTSLKWLTESLDVEPRVSQLAVLQSEVAACTRCAELASCRQNTVFGVGNPQPQLCFVGEGPGADEDRQGEPFVGAAGQLLDKIIEAGKLKRQDVYILNTVKCRPPGNRNPNELELQNCWPYAVAQLEILQPQFICCLGSVAARTLLGTTESIGRLRGRLFQFRGSKVVVTYHPAYLLRNPSAKRQVWDDVKMLLAAMGREV